jgi:GT2 family glycosyltransferase
MSVLQKVYILIINWNNWEDTVECLESVFQGSYPNFQVICIDNGSTDGSEQKIKDWAGGKITASNVFFEFNADNKPIQFITYDKETAENGGDPEKESSLVHKGAGHALIFIRTGSNYGYAGGNNIGMRYVLKKGDGQLVWILNNDTVVDRDALSEMIAGIDNSPGVGMAGSKLLYFDKVNVLQSAGGCNLSAWSGNTRLIANNQEDDGRWDEPSEPDYICGASLLVKREAIENIGLMDENYFLYWEDADWGVRARREGYRLLYCPKSRVWHKEGGTGGGVNLTTDYYWTRNGLFFMKKFYPVFLPLIPFSYFIKYTLVRLIRKKPLNFLGFSRGVLDFIRGRTGKIKRMCTDKAN